MRAWREAGVGEAELGALGRIAAAMWAGLFKAAGFRYVGRSAHAGDGDMHVLQIERAGVAGPERHAEHPTTH